MSVKRKKKKIMKKEEGKTRLQKRKQKKTPKSIEYNNSNSSSSQRKNCEFHSSNRHRPTKRSLSSCLSFENDAATTTAQTHTHEEVSIFLLKKSRSSNK